MTCPSLLNGQLGQRSTAEPQRGVPAVIHVWTIESRCQPDRRRWLTLTSSQHRAQLGLRSARAVTLAIETSQQSIARPGVHEQSLKYSD